MNEVMVSREKSGKNRLFVKWKDLKHLHAVRLEGYKGDSLKNGVERGVKERFQWVVYGNINSE